MAPGDCLYLPRGFIHSAAAQEGVSLHLTIGVLATTVHDLLRRVVDGTADDPTFRRALPPGHASDVAPARTVIKDAIAALPAWFDGVYVAALGPGPADSAASRRNPLPDRQLLDPAGPARITTASVRDAP